MAKRYWLMKSEPSEFGIEDLERKGESLWDGIRNYQVRNLIRDDMKVGDQALFYHSSCKDVGVAGEMEIVGKPVPDPTQFDPLSHYYDPKSQPENPRWLAVSVRHVATWGRVVPLAALRQDPKLANLTILKAGNRLSITEVTKEEYNIIRKM
ncbi:MAG: EVE domain-containing protein [Candidatus Pacebacteria bacterium]|jgi:predicted RNA-binding protein with PUA-like domain|nr:EVE domain-containing protein [Candidatus Paceibacterota bacterium]